MRVKPRWLLQDCFATVRESLIVTWLPDLLKGGRYAITTTCLLFGECSGKMFGVINH